jgi:hypothetical protein
LVDLEEAEILRRHVGAERRTFGPEPMACALGEPFPPRIAAIHAIERFGSGLGVAGAPERLGKVPVLRRSPVPRRHRRLGHAEGEEQLRRASGREHGDRAPAAVATAVLRAGDAGHETSSVAVTRSMTLEQRKIVGVTSYAREDLPG